MLTRARARLARQCPQATMQVEFRHGTQAALGAADCFGVLITFFVLDCIALPELAGALAQLRNSQRPDAPWLLADFRAAQRGWRWMLLRLMYTFFRLTTGLRAQELPDLPAALARLGLHPARRRRFYAGAVEAAIFTESGTIPYATI